MKKLLLPFVINRNSLQRLAFAISSVMVCSHLNAQAPADLVATVPFTFQIGPTRMPAGTYVIHQKDDVLTVRQPGIGGRAVVLMTLHTSRDSTRQDGVLEFHRYGKVSFLAKVWSPHVLSGCALPEGSVEKKLASRIGPYEETGIPAKAE